MMISKAAAQVLIEHSKVTGPLFVPTIVWAENEGGVGAWEVGYHERAIVPQIWIEEIEGIEGIEGIEIVIEPHWHDKLNDKTLDVVEGHFHVF